MTGTLTYTGTAGAGQALTAVVFSSVTKLEYDLGAEVLRVTYGTPSITAHLDLSLIATGTLTFVTGVSLVAVAST